MNKNEYCKLWYRPFRSAEDAVNKTFFFFLYRSLQKQKLKARRMQRLFFGTNAYHISHWMLNTEYKMYAMHIREQFSIDVYFFDITFHSNRMPHVYVHRAQTTWLVVAIFLRALGICDEGFPNKWKIK